MDRWLIEERGFTLPALMEAAGAALASAARQALLERGACRVVLLVGPGHNGGDALVAGRLLRQRHGLEAETWRPLAEPPRRPRLDADTLLVDGLFGVGLCRPLQGEARAAVEHVNAGAADVLAVDIPSGLHATSGAVLGAAVRARRTLCFVGPKAGFFVGAGPAHVGAWTVAEIGFPAVDAEVWVRARRAGRDSEGGVLDGPRERG